MSTRQNIRKEALWRAGLFGVGLFLILTPDRVFNLHLNLVSYLAATTWSCVDGILPNHSPGRPLIEGAVVHVIAVQVCNLLLLFT